MTNTSNSKDVTFTESHTQPTPMVSSVSSKVDPQQEEPAQLTTMLNTSESSSQSPDGEKKTTDSHSMTLIDKLLHLLTRLEIKLLDTMSSQVDTNYKSPDSKLMSLKVESASLDAIVYQSHSNS